MRMLGPRASFQVFRWDLIYLVATTGADKRPEVKALTPLAQSMLDDVKARRDTHENAEDAAVVTFALLRTEDRERDALVVEMGGVARATDKVAYDSMFAKHNPSATARLPLSAEAAELQRILGELGKLPVTHALRVAYEARLLASEKLVKAAGLQNDAAVTTLALERSETERFKLAIDKRRLALHGHLTAICQNKEETDSFFRPTSNPPGEEKQDDPTAVATPAAPAPI